MNGYSKIYGKNQNIFQSATWQCFQFYNVTDIVNRSLVSFFIIAKVTKKNSGVVAIQDRIIT